MADNLTALDAALATIILAAKEIAGVKYPRSILTAPDGSDLTPLTDAQLRATAVPVSGPVTDAQMRATALPVSGPLTDGQLRATAVPVSGTLALDAPTLAALENIQANTGGLTDGELRATALPVSGPLTDGQLRATAVPVSGPVTDAQMRATALPVSGPLTDAQLRSADVPTALRSLYYPASTGNNTTAQLAANAKFTGTIETVQNLQAAQIQVVCDQPYTLTINQYIDAAGTKLTESTTLTRLANQPLCQNVLLPGNYFNVVLTNLGISDTTALQIDTTFGIMDTLPKTLGQKARDESMAVTLSVDDLEMLSDIRQALAPLMSARGTDGALRINSLGGTLTTVSTVTGVTTVSTVTSVTALANQTAMGGMQAGPHIPSLMNLAAQANIANMIG